jgi:manganese/zinc/iron transport system permease protein
MDLLDLLFGNYTLRTVALGSAIIGATSGMMGSFALLRKQSLLGDAMSHAALPGIVIAFLLTGLRTPLVLLVGAFVSAWLGSLIIGVVTRETRIKQDSGLGIVLAVFFGLGLVLLSWVQRNVSGSQAGLEDYLFGKAAALVQADVTLMSVIGGASLLVVLLFWKEFKLLSFDPEFATTLGYPVRLLDVLLTSLIVVGIVVGLQVVGVVLMAALLVAPAAAARQWTDRLNLMVLLSALLGGAGGAAGAVISSTARGLSTGPVIVLVVSAMAVISLFVAPNRGLIAEWLRQRRNRRRIGTERVMEALYLMAQNHNDPTYPHSIAALRAALPGYDVAAALDLLRERGLVAKLPNDEWALTPKGTDRVEKLRKQTHGDMQEAPA